MSDSNQIQVSRVWQGCGKGVTRVCQWCGKGVSMVCQGYGKGVSGSNQIQVSRVCQGVSMVCQGVSMVCQGCGKGEARVCRTQTKFRSPGCVKGCQGCVNGVARVWQGCVGLKPNSGLQGVALGYDEAVVPLVYKDNVIIVIHGITTHG